MKTTISVTRAIWVGLIAVNGPVLLIMFGPLLLFGQMVNQGTIARTYNWLGLIVLAVGFVLAWLWWSISVPRWRLWAYERVTDIPLLKVRAVTVGLTWPDGHVFGKTEIKSKSHVQREHELDPSE